MSMCDIDEIMNDPLMFDLVHNDILDINKMSDKEIRESIIHDILMVTMIEKEENVTLDFSQSQLLRWIKPMQHSYVLAQMNNKEIAGLIENKNGQLRIKDKTEILQAAMDYCGNWYNGFKPPESIEGILYINFKDFQTQIEKTDIFHQLYQNVFYKIATDLMDLNATVSGTKTIQ